MLVDGRGVTTTSATMSNRRVDNSPLRGYDVQAVNGGGTAGRLDAGDVIRLTYSDQVRLDSISPGWTGAAVPVTVRVRDGLLLGLGSGDTLDVLRGGASVNLGSVNLKQNFVSLFQTAQLNATMAATTSTVNGVPVTTVTLTLGTVSSGGGLKTVSGAGAMVWTPSAAATDLAGVPSSTSATVELGTSDRDF